MRFFGWMGKSRAIQSDPAVTLSAWVTPQTTTTGTTTGTTTFPARPGAIVSYLTASPATWVWGTTPWVPAPRRVFGWASRASEILPGQRIE